MTTVASFSQPKEPQIRDSINYYSKAIESDRNNAAFYLKRGIFHLEAGSDFLALADVSRAVEFSPKDPVVYYERSRIYFEQRRSEKALVDINKALALDSTQTDLYIARAMTLSAMFENEKALQDYNKAVAMDKNNFVLYLARAAAYYEMENIDAACADYLVVKSFIDKGKVKDASVAADVKARSKDICDSTRASYYYQRAIGLYNLNEFKKATEMYERGLKKFPKNPMMLSFAGNALLALGEYEKAIAAYTQSLNYKDALLAEIKLNPNFENAPAEMLNQFLNGSLASTYFTMSQAKLYLNRFDEALADINKAIDLAPDIKDFKKEEYFNLRGHINLARNKYDLAIKDFEKSIELNNRYASPYVNRAVAKISMGARVKVRSYSVRSNARNQPMNVTWEVPDKSSLASKQVALMFALNDCKMAIAIDKQFGYAFHIRGQVKQMLGHKDYCYDLLAARKYGMVVEEELMKGCGR